MKTSITLLVVAAALAVPVHACPKSPNESDPCAACPMQVAIAQTAKPSRAESTKPTTPPTKADPRRAKRVHPAYLFM